LIPTRDRADLLSKCITSIQKLSTYQHYEIIIINNGSQEKATYDFFEQVCSPSVRILNDDSPFNFSALNNGAAKIAKGSVLCLLNNDIEIVTPDWLEEMLSFAVQDEIGCVGARLWYPNERLQHAGVVVGIGGVAGHIHHDLPRSHPGYIGRAVLHQSFSAVTAACLMIRKQVYMEVGGLDENLDVAFNDVDFCLRVHQVGYRNLWTPYAEMIHVESATRGPDTTPKNLIRFQRDSKYMQDRWGQLLLKDPAYNPNLSLESVNMNLAWPPRVDATC